MAHGHALNAARERAGPWAVRHRPPRGGGGGGGAARGAGWSCMGTLPEIPAALFQRGRRIRLLAAIVWSSTWEGVMQDTHDRIAALVMEGVEANAPAEWFERMLADMVRPLVDRAADDAFARGVMASRRVTSRV